LSTGQTPGRRSENRRLSFPAIFYNSVYNSKLQLRDTTTTTTTATTTAVTEVVFAFRAKNFEKYHFKNQ
jgi:hypothetical protein